MTYEIALVTILAAVLAGTSWNGLAIWQKWRQGDNAKVDWKRVRKNVIIGAVLGIIAYGLQVSAGDTTVVIDSIESLVIAVIGFFPLVVIADKIFTKKNK